MFKDMIQAEVVIFWIAKLQHQGLRGSQVLCRNVICYENSVETMSAATQPAFGVVCDSSYPVEKLRGDKVVCELGQGIVGNTLKSLETTHVLLDVDSNGKIQSRNDMCDPEVDLPPGMVPKQMSCVCIPVIFEGTPESKNVGLRRTSTLSCERETRRQSTVSNPIIEDSHFGAAFGVSAEPSPVRPSPVRPSPVRPSPVRPSPVRKESNFTSSPYFEDSSDDEDTMPIFDYNETGKQKKSLIGVLEFSNKSNLWSKPSFFKIEEVVRGEAFASTFAAYIAKACILERSLYKFATYMTERSIVHQKKEREILRQRIKEDIKEAEEQDRKAGRIWVKSLFIEAYRERMLESPEKSTHFKFRGKDSKRIIWQCMAWQFATCEAGGKEEVENDIAIIKKERDFQQQLEEHGTEALTGMMSGGMKEVKVFVSVPVATYEPPQDAALTFGF